VLAIASEILSRLGLDGRYTITVNDLEIFNGITESLALDAGAREQMRQLVDVHNATALRSFLAAYASANECDALGQLAQLSGKAEVFDKARRVIANTRSLVAVDRLAALWRTIDSLGLSDRFEIDLGDVSRLDYYTGLVFKIYVAGAGSRIGSGGRYDQLTANFGKAEPAVGFVLDLDTLSETVRAGSGTILTDEPVKEALSIGHEDPTKLFLEALQLRARAERVVIGQVEETTCRT